MTISSAQLQQIDMLHALVTWKRCADCSANFTTDSCIDNSTGGDSDDEDGDNETTGRKAQERLTYKRTKEAIIRFHKEKEEGETKYRHLLMPYYPW